jgi:hypothetical protein
LPAALPGESTPFASELFPTKDFAAAHLGHWGTEGAFVDARLCSLDGDDSLVEYEPTQMERDRQQHETPPKIWL